jgi:hypothetical protein
LQRIGLFRGFRIAANVNAALAARNAGSQPSLPFPSARNTTIIVLAVALYAQGNMTLRIQILHDIKGIRKLLEIHGWRLCRAVGSSFYSARHPKAFNQMTARVQLEKAGLLISNAVRIDFCPRAFSAD